MIPVYFYLFHLKQCHQNSPAYISRPTVLSYLFLEMNCKFKSLIEDNKLILINSLISNDEKPNNFYKNKKNSVLSTIVPPKNLDNWEIVELKSEKLSSIIKTYLKIYNAFSVADLIRTDYFSGSDQGSLLVKEKKKLHSFYLYSFLILSITILILITNQ